MYFIVEYMSDDISFKYDYVVQLGVVLVFFFFKQKTAYEMRISDWSSDVCSSDLRAACPDVCGGHGNDVVAPVGAGCALRQCAAAPPAWIAWRLDALAAEHSGSRPRTMRDRAGYAGLRRIRCAARRPQPRRSCPGDGGRPPCTGHSRADRRHRLPTRPDERRVGKGCVSPGRSRWSAYH